VVYLQRDFPQVLGGSYLPRSDALVEALARGNEPIRQTAVVAEAAREDHPLNAFATGLAACGYDVVRTSDGPTIEHQWQRPTVMACWNGLRDGTMARASEAMGVPLIRLEHGFWDRHNYTQADHEGILHWASWAERIAGPAPQVGRRRLDRFVHDRQPMRARSDGYVLVLGQIANDTQMLDSEIRGPVPLQRYVKRALPKGVQAYFRPHPAARYRPHPRHETLPMMGGNDEAGDYRKTKGGTGLAEALAGARFIVTINSNAIVEACCAGVPCLAFGPHLGIAAGAVARTTLPTLRNDIESMLSGWAPEQAVVDNYLCWLASRQWNNEELSAGAVVGELLELAGIDPPEVNRFPVRGGKECHVA
jgi:hypothetical protein